MEESKILNLDYVYNPKQIIGHPDRPSAFKRTNFDSSSSLNFGKMTMNELILRNKYFMSALSRKYAQSTLNTYTPTSEVVETKSETHLTPRFGAMNSTEIFPKFCDGNNMSSESVGLLDESTTNNMEDQLNYIFSSNKPDRDSLSDHTTKSDFTPKCSSRLDTTYSECKMVGAYTVKERQDKIRKYKLKIQKWRQGLNKNKDRYSKRRAIAKNKPRIGGKFVKMAD